MQRLVQTISEALLRAGLVQVEVSARHVHLSAEDTEALFGPGAVLTPKRELSQPGQFLAEERVVLIGPKGVKERTAVLGPARVDTQIELSKSDCVALGINAPVRQSGDVDGSASITLEGPCGRILVRQGCIIAQNHLHLTPETAKILTIKDRQVVAVRILTSRPVVFPRVLTRVSSAFRDRMHLDFDEANAACVEDFTLGKILSAEQGGIQL